VFANELVNYKYEVRAVDNAGNVSSINSVQFEGLDLTPPVWNGTAATILSDGYSPSTQYYVYIAHSSATDAASDVYYEYYFKKSTETEYSLNPLVVAQTTTTQLYPLQGNTSYDFKVVAVDSYGNENQTALFASGSTEDLEPPYWLEYQDVNKNSSTQSSIEITFPNAVDDGGGSIDFYSIYQDGVFVKNITSTTTTMSGLTPLTSYDFSVTATDDSGNVSTDGVDGFNHRVEIFGTLSTSAAQTDLGSARSTSESACDLSTSPQTYYINSSVISFGTRVFTDSSGTNPLNGGNQWRKDFTNTGIDRVIQIDSNGYVVDITGCGF
jgi:hypothetical protein